MTIRPILTLLLFTSALFIHAQSPFYKNYSWEKKPAFNKIKTNPKEDLVSYKLKLVNEFYFEEGNLVEYNLMHKVLWLNSNEKIEEYNKIYIPYDVSSEILVNKARVITKSGKIIELDKSKIMTAEDEETKRVYKYFAFEGIELGSFIEYYYALKRVPKYNGRKVILQEPYKSHNVDFELFAPKNLLFKFKSYNQLAEIEQDTLMTEKNHWHLHADSVIPLKNEQDAPYDAVRKYLVYKLYKNTAGNVYDISSYVKMAKNVYSHLYSKLSDKENRVIDDIVEKAGLKEDNTDEENIRNLENYLKANFYYANFINSELEDISIVVENKVANDNGFLKIYIAALKKINIPSEVVLTCNRHNSWFDTDFDAGNYLSNYLIYFPSVGKYTAVDKLESRLGFPPAEFTDNYGLFIKEVKVGNYTTGIGQVKYITPIEAKYSGEKMFIKVAFDDEDLSQNNITINREMVGYFAMYIQPYLNMTSEENLNELYEGIIKSISENLTVKNITPYNAKTELFGVKPFKLIADVETSTFVDKAGKKYLFKLGELIGPQIEMYQENERKLPLEDDFKRHYEREIQVEIPKGYKITNLDDINIENYLMKNQKKIFEFHSFYKIEGNKLSVFVNEYYHENRISLDIFKGYRKVVNSAADFNKVVLVLEPI